MEIGRKLKEARLKKGLTQEQVARRLLVSRQRVSNWETEKSWPDIVSLIKFSDLRGVSLDSLLKEDKEMINHLKSSTDIVSAGKKIFLGVMLNLRVLLVMFCSARLLPFNPVLVGAVFSMAVISTGLLIWRIVRRL